MILEFLTINLKTIDGQRNTAVSIIKKLAYAADEDHEDEHIYGC